MPPRNHTIGVMISQEALGQGDSAEIVAPPEQEYEIEERYTSEDEDKSGGTKAAAAKSFRSYCKAEEEIGWRKAHWDAAAVKELEVYLELKLKEQTPTQAHYALREKVIERVNSVVSNGLLQYNGMHVEHYGSFTSGLFTPNGDLDISIEGTLKAHPNTQRRGSELLDGLEGLNVSQLDKDEKAALLRALGNKLKNKQICAGRIEFILHARVPIIKFVESLTEIPCDMAVGSGGARFKSTVLLHLSRIDARFPDLLRLVKLWAKAYHMNDASNGTFNTFALTLMVIFHLQTRSPPVLPPICELFDLPAHATTERPLHKGREADMSLLQVSERRAANWRGGGNKESVLELLSSFFSLYSGALSVWAGSQAERAVRCSTWAGDWFHRPWTRNYIVPVEDPFDVTDNCARSIFAANVVYVRGCFTKGHQALQTLHPGPGVEVAIAGLFSQQEAPRIRHPFARNGWKEAGWGRNGNEGANPKGKGRNRRSRNGEGPARGAESSSQAGIQPPPPQLSKQSAEMLEQVSQQLERQQMQPPGMGPPVMSRASSGGVGGMGPPGGFMPPGLAAPPLQPYSLPQLNALQQHMQYSSQMQLDRAAYGVRAALAAEGLAAPPPPGFAVPGVAYGGAHGRIGEHRGNSSDSYLQYDAPPGYSRQSQAPPYAPHQDRGSGARGWEPQTHPGGGPHPQWAHPGPERAGSSAPKLGTSPGPQPDPLGKLFAEAAERYQRQQGQGMVSHTGQPAGNVPSNPLAARYQAQDSRHQRW